METVYTLNKREIGEAIVEYIGRHMKNEGFFPYSIEKTKPAISLPEEVSFVLKYIPKGTLTFEVNHKI